MKSKSYEFTLNFRLPDDCSAPEELVERLAAAGCDDAIIGTGIPGRISLQFDRMAISAHEAINTAKENVETAIPGATLTEAAPDYVGLTELSAVLGISRQAARKKMLSNATFPAPVHSGNPSLWRLSHLLTWAELDSGQAIPSEKKEVAQVTCTLNLETEANRANFRLIPTRSKTEIDQLIREERASWDR